MTATNKTVVIIPARGGSKRVPNKNIRLLAGNPLIAYSIQTAKSLNYPVYVTSDSELILKIASDWGAIPVLRPPYFSSDISPDIQWAGHFLGYYKEKEGDYPEKIVFLRPTTPLRNGETVKRGLDSLNEDSSSLRSVQPLAEAPEKAFRIEGDYLIPAVPNLSSAIRERTNLPNQAFSTAYTGNGYVDIIRPETLLQTGTMYGDKIQAFITEKTVDIDDLNDFKYAEYLLTGGQ